MNSEPQITFVLPYYNEAGFIAETLASLAAQTDRRFALVLVDNGSTDDGPQQARAAAAKMPDIAVSFLREETPGKLFALRSGIARVSSTFVGSMDADTKYPPDYVARTLDLFRANPASSAVIAFGVPGSQPSIIKLLQTRIWPMRCHSGGCGQNFRTAQLLEAGQFDPAIWPFVLEDHEIQQRMTAYGPPVYDSAHVCHPSDRRSDRTGVSWTPLERALYKLLPPSAMDWFFYRFLTPRFADRGLSNLQLRNQHWQSEAADQSSE